MKELDIGPTEIFWRTNWNIYQKPRGERVTGKKDGEQIAREERDTLRIKNYA